jgi:hypothetical protein
VSQPTPLKKNLVPRFEITRGGEEWVWDRGVTYEIQLALLHLRAWLVVVDSRSGVLLELLEVLLSWVRALLCVMPGLSTIVAQTGWNVFGLGDLLWGFLDKAEPVPLLFPCPLRGSRRCRISRELSGLVSVTSSFALVRMGLRTGNFSLTYIYIR